MSAHTPGPWAVASADACQEIDVMEIAEVSHLRVIPARDRWPTPGEPEADAALIAAAPELLAALKVVTAHLASPPPSNQGWNAALNMAEAAIAKAEGRA